METQFTERATMSHVLACGAFALRVQVLPGDFGKQKVLDSSNVGVDATITKRYKDASAAQRVNMMVEWVKGAMDATLGNKPVDDLLLLAAETIEDALLFFSGFSLDFFLLRHRPFLFPCAELPESIVPREAAKMHPKYAEAAENGKPYVVAILVTIGSHAEEVRRAFGNGKNRKPKQCRKCGQLFAANELLDALNRKEVHNHIILPAIA